MSSCIMRDFSSSAPTPQTHGVIFAADEEERGQLGIVYQSCNPLCGTMGLLQESRLYFFYLLFKNFVLPTNSPVNRPSPSTRNYRTEQNKFHGLNSGFYSYKMWCRRNVIALGSKRSGFEGRSENRLCHHLLLQNISDQVLRELGLSLNSLHSLFNAVALAHHTGNPPDYLIANGVILIDVFTVSPHVAF
jgi:hypothetical protein